MKIKSTLIEAHIIRRNTGKIEYLLMKRSANKRFPNVWQMVTGSIEENEKGYEAAKREIFEETSLVPNSIWIVPNVNSFYSEYDDSINFVPVFVAEVDSFSEVKISQEHSEFVWCKMSKAMELLAWPGQKKSVEIIEGYFGSENSKLELIKIKEGEL